MWAFSAISFGIYILCCIYSVNSGTVFKTIIKAGTGPQIQTNQIAVVHYTGTLQSGEKFDSSRDRGEPFEFTLGKGEVIPGWDAGVATMKVGERAQLEIAPEDAYGAEGIPPTIPPNAILNFDIELIAIKGSKPSAQPGSPGSTSQGTAGGASQSTSGGTTQGGTSGIPQGQPGMGTSQQGVSFSNIPPAGTGTSGMTGMGTGQQAVSQPGTGFQNGAGMMTSNQFLSGISPPGITSSSGNVAGSSMTGQQGVRFSGMPQTQGTSSGSTAGQGTQISGPQGSSAATGLSMFRPGMSGAGQMANNLATQGQGLSFGSQSRDLSSQPQRMPALPGTGTFASGNIPQQAVSRQTSSSGNGQSMFSSGSQFQGMPGFVGSPTGQSSFGLTNSFQNDASSSMGTGAGFRPMQGQTARQPGMMTQPGFSRNGMTLPGGSGSFNGGLNRQQSVGGMSSTRQFGANPQPDRPVRMNTDQPSTRMQPLDRGTMGFGMGARGMPEMMRRPDGLFPELNRTPGFGGIPDMRRRTDGRGMIDILRSRGMGFPDPRGPGPDPRAMGMRPGMTGPSRFAPPGMMPRGIPPAMLERLRMLRRMRGF